MNPIKNQKGFTLIELMLIVIVLGVLSAVAVLEFKDLRSDAEAAGNMAYIGALRSAISIRFAEQLVREGDTSTGADVIGNTAATAGATVAQIEAMVKSTAPSGITTTDNTKKCGEAGATWTGKSPGNPPAATTWTLTCGATASDPISIN